ncbi:MAG TPA: CDGSH iron-sulfur domain-containing protein [Candidatus Cybelea sp.]|jgi:CDGSH-type Zn-finger protein
MDEITEVTIKVRESGPYLIRGKITLTDVDGNPYTVKGENVALCRCGGSQTKPFCDGSHRTNGFAATERATVEASTEVEPTTSVESSTA